MGRFKCTECSATFPEESFAAEELICPSCGGRLDAESQSDYTTAGNKRTSTPSEKWMARVLVLVSVLFPFAVVGTLEVCANVVPHVLTLELARKIISISFLVAIGLVFVTTSQPIKFRTNRALIRLPVLFIYIAISFLNMCRSYCDPHWFGEEYDEEGTVAGCTDTKVPSSEHQKESPTRTVGDGLRESVRAGAKP